MVFSNSPRLRRVFTSSGSTRADRQLRDFVHLIAVQPERHQGVEVTVQVNLVW